jgi:hypothetical protein
MFVRHYYTSGPVVVLLFVSKHPCFQLFTNINIFMHAITTAYTERESGIYRYSSVPFYDILCLAGIHFENCLNFLSH